MTTDGILTKRDMIMRVFLDVIGIVAVMIVMAAILMYQRMDHKKFMAMENLRMAEDDCARWLSEAQQLFAVGKTEENLREKYGELVRQYSSCKRTGGIRKVEILNEACGMFRDIAYDYYDDPGMEAVSLRLTETASSLEPVITRYNYYAFGFNSLLGKKGFSHIGKLFGFKQLPALDSLQIR